MTLLEILLDKLPARIRRYSRVITDVQEAQKREWLKSETLSVDRVAPAVAEDYGSFPLPLPWPRLSGGFDPKYVYTFRRALLYPHDGSVLVANRLVIESVGHPANAICKAMCFSGVVFAYKVFRRIRTLPVDGDHCFLFLRYDGYFHFVIESLVSLLWALEVVPEATVLVEKDRYRGYYKDYVDRLVELGVIKKTHFIRSNELLSVRNLVMTSREEDSGMFSHAAVSLIRNTFTSLGAKVSAQADRKIFLTRRKRRFDNQDELEKIAEELGYELVDTEGMSVLSQIELFRSISAVVTNHGAGLTNLIYAHPGTRVVELFSNNWLNDCYFRLARQCEHQYDCMISAPGTSWGVIDVTEFRRKLT